MPLQYPRHSHPWSSLSYGRRRFLRASTAALTGLALTNCHSNLTPGSSDQKRLYIYTWANYTDPQITKLFTQRTGIQVIFDVFDSNEVMLTKLQSGGGNAYSILYPSDYMVAQMVKLGMLTPIDPDRVKGLQNLRSRWINPPYDRHNGHSIPFSTGTTGLLYHADSAIGQPQDWDFLWDHRQALSRRITLIDDMREVVGATLKSLGYSYNTNDATQIKAAYSKLQELKPHIAAFKTNGFEDEILSGDLTIAMAYSMDAMPLIRANPRLQYLIPRSGTSIWTDTLAIPASAPNLEAAYQWINFMLEPEVAAGMTERLSLGTVNQAALDRLSGEIRNNQSLYPKAEILANSETIQPLTPATNDLFDRLWTAMTTS
ncbi:MAG: spermidine/putrescine ABC transporter substrate-binding protein [Cyanobacteria bacterium REEB459]|nr:spermidine/putrescine ABC transporter substrate-binding protein [Cyanobacteria bacterium REEB459]